MPRFQHDSCHAFSAPHGPASPHAPSRKRAPTNAPRFGLPHPNPDCPTQTRDPLSIAENHFACEVIPAPQPDAQNSPTILRTYDAAIRTICDHFACEVIFQSRSPLAARVRQGRLGSGRRHGQQERNDEWNVRFHSVLVPPPRLRRHASSGAGATCADAPPGASGDVQSLRLRLARVAAAMSGVRRGEAGERARAAGRGWARLAAELAETTG